MRDAEAFSPAHITGLFQILDRSKNLLKVGSKGAGVSVTLGVTTSVRVESSATTSCRILINGERSDTALVSKQVLNCFLSMVEGSHRILVEHRVAVPIGQGFGSSGAGALSLALALNEAFKLNLPRLEAAQIAHVAEVKCKTGLGTVIGETFGGLEIRLKPGAPGVGEIRRIPISHDYVVVCLYSKPISTKRILTSGLYRQRVNEVGGKLTAELAKHPTPAKFMGLSRKFAEHLGLISNRLRPILDETDKAGITFSMAMLGESLFALIKLDQVTEIRKIFDKKSTLSSNMVITDIDRKGARLL